jgi:hypothetical protein
MDGWMNGWTDGWMDKCVCIQGTAESFGQTLGMSSTKQEKVSISTCVRKYFLFISVRKPCRHQQQFNVNIWHVLPHRFAGKHYGDFFLHGLPKLLEVVPLAVRSRMWYMHDGATRCSQ